MTYKALLTYFRPTGKYLTSAEILIGQEAITKIWEEVNALRRLGRLPGLRPNAGRDLFVVVDVPDHPENVPYLVMPPFVDEDDLTPPRIPTEEMKPLVRVPLEEIPRTTTRDVVKIAPAEADEEITPVDTPILKDPNDENK